jgi:hypothetical protein
MDFERTNFTGESKLLIRKELFCFLLEAGLHLQ